MRRDRASNSSRYLAWRRAQAGQAAGLHVPAALRLLSRSPDRDCKPDSTPASNRGPRRARRKPRPPHPPAGKRLAFENIRNGRNELPPAGFHLERGIAIFGVFLIYGVILQIPGWVIGIAGGFASHHSDSGLNIPSPLVGLGYLWGFLASLFLSYLVPSLIVHTYHHGFAGGMNVSGVWRLAQNNVSNSVVAGALIWVASIIGELGLVVCFIGIIFTIPYQNVMQAGVAAWLERVNAAPAPAPGGAPAA